MTMRPLLIIFSVLTTVTCSAQNVGINTSTPGYPLTVQSTSIGISQETADGTVKVGFYTNNSLGAYLQTHTLNDLNFSTNNGLPQMVLKTNGNVGIGLTSPNATLSVGRGTGIDGSAAFFGTDHVSHFNYNVSEDTYIRAGKDNSAVIINDIPGGRVGIGMSGPTRAMLEQQGAVGNTTAIFGGESQGVSLQGNTPGIGFNHYYDAVNNRSLSVGYAGQFALDETNGTLFYKAWSTFSVIPNGLLSNSNTLKKFNINRFGKAGFGTNSMIADPGLPDLAICQSSLTPSSSSYARTNGLSLSFSNNSVNDNISINLSLGDLVDGPTWQNALKIYGFPFGGPIAIIHPNTGQYIQLSDSKAKKDISRMETGVLGSLMQLRPSVYHMQNDIPGAKWKYGFISQEVEKVFPDMVFGTGDYKMMSYESLIPVAIRAIQEQQEMIVELKKEMEVLKGQMHKTGKRKP